MTTIKEENIDHAWDFILEAGIATAEEMLLVTKLNGYKWDVLMDVIHVRTGYQDIEQYIECEFEGGTE